MNRSFLFLLKKDFKLMLSGKFFLLMLGSLILYSCYINLVYVKLDAEIYPVYIYDPMEVQTNVPKDIIVVDSISELKSYIVDGFSVGINLSDSTPKILMTTSGQSSTDTHRAAYALSLLSLEDNETTEIIGNNTKEMKNRLEMVCEFIFFELVAVGFLGLASIIFKEKQMGVIRVHGILPINKTAFILSKICLFLVADFIFVILLTIGNIGLSTALSILPNVLVQTGIMSLIISLIGLFCAIQLKDFKQFSLLYVILSIFILSPVFLAGQTDITFEFIKFHPIYYLFMAMKNSFFAFENQHLLYYIICIATISTLFFLVKWALNREMAKEG